MIVVDSSAVVAIFREEAEAELIAKCLVADGYPVMSVATYLEIAIVLRGSRLAAAKLGDQKLDNFLAEEDIELRPVSVEQGRLAVTAFRQFGKGTGHGAALNFGDCFAYALAKSLDVPLLYKGNDFARTDIISALA